MPDAEQPKRGRGRPRVNPVEGNRRNVTLQVSLELYERLRSASEASGLSISREIESRTQSSFDNTAVHQALEEATQSIREKIDSEYVEFFHGHDGLTWAKATADIYSANLTKLMVETGWTGDQDLPDDFAETLLERVRNEMGKVAEDWKNRVLLSQMLSKIDRDQIGPFVERLLEASPALKERLEAAVARRNARSSDSSEKA